MTGINPLNPNTETIFLLQGEDDEHLRNLRARAEAAKPKRGIPQTMDESDDADALKREADEFADEAKERGVKVVLRALGRRAWKDLVAKHPPRDKNETDKALGANVDALQEELVALCIASPAGSPAEMEAFLDSLSEGQFGHLAVTAYQLNMGRGADPTRRLLSSGSHTSSATSN